MALSVPVIQAHRAASAEALRSTGPVVHGPIGGITLSAGATTAQPEIRYYRQHSSRRLRSVLNVAWWVGIGYSLLGLFVGGAAIWMTLDQALFAANPQPIPWPVLLYALSLGTSGIVTALGCVYCLSGNATGLLLLKYGERAALLFQLVTSLIAAIAAVTATAMFGVNSGSFMALCVAMLCLMLGWMIVPVLLMLLADRQEVRRSFGLVREDPNA
jgi:hypothetical protein